ncbi:MAG: hypothetical protein AAB279_06230, partial [Candidatus Binatota bacterium]
QCSVTKPDDFSVQEPALGTGVLARLKKLGPEFFVRLIEVAPSVFGLNDMGIRIDNHGRLPLNL